MCFPVTKIHYKYEAEVKPWGRIVTDVKQTHKMSSIRTLTLKFVKTSKVISTLSETCFYRYLLGTFHFWTYSLHSALTFNMLWFFSFVVFLWFLVVGFFFFFNVARLSKVADLLRYLIIFAHRQGVEYNQYLGK